MPAIAKSIISNTTSSIVTTTTLDGSTDTLTLTNKTSVLILENGTGGTLSPVISGDESTTVTVGGIAPPIDVSGGTAAFGAIADGTEKMLKINIAKSQLQGSITITGGTGLIARLLEVE